MTIELGVVSAVLDDIDIVAVLAAEGDAGASGVDWDVVRRLGFEGKAGTSQVVAGSDGRLVAVVGLGPTDAVDASALRKAGATLARGVRRHRSVAISLPEPANVAVAHATQAFFEGVLLASYSFDRYRSAAEPSRVARVSLVAPADPAEAEAALARATRIAEAVSWTRDLVNEPGGTLTPQALADAAVEMAEREGLDITVLDETAIAEARLGGLLGVNRGSTQPPRFLELRHVPADESSGTVALVGKGITFDSGGLSIKPADAMAAMKADMGGAAAVLGAMSAVATFAPHLEVRAYVPVTDNMLGGDATRPGDVIRIRNGTTVEVLNTDAEGRLVLADALCLAVEGLPDAVIDLATLTGACVVGLGERIAGLMGNHSGWRTQVAQAADRAGERVWPLPLPDDYRSFLDSSVADMKNIGPRYGGALTAGLFLRGFVPDSMPWAHLDIAGPAWVDEEDGINAKGGTGFGVRTLLALLEGFTPLDDERNEPSSA